VRSAVALRPLPDAGLIPGDQRLALGLPANPRRIAPPSRARALSTFAISLKPFVTLQAGGRCLLVSGPCRRVSPRKQDDMAVFLALGSYTEQGFRQTKQPVSCTEDFKRLAVQYGMAVKDVFWMRGQQYDMVAVLEGPNRETAQALLLVINTRGNVRTQLLRAYAAEEIEAFSVGSTAEAPNETVGAVADHRPH
jgi:uncharacterized protein with GYD domain